MDLILVCGPWSSGTTAVSGMLAELGARGLPPYFATNDPRTPNSFESLAFRELIGELIEEDTLRLRVDWPTVRTRLAGFRDRVEAEAGEDVAPLFLKYPLSALLIPEICQAFSTRLVYVLRLTPGDTLRVFDGAGAEFEAELQAQGKRGLLVKPLHAVESRAESPLAVHLGLGLARGERMDWALQKATELGVASITPLTLERCTAKLVADRGDNRLRHWRQIVTSACEQCGRTVVPQLTDAMTLDAWLAHNASIPGVVLHTRAASRLDNARRPDALRVLIGPEGGISEVEFGQAMRAGFVPVSLGPRVLRAETAPLALLAIVQYLWGDM